jgi:hypothetical protein
MSSAHTECFFEFLVRKKTVGSSMKRHEKDERGKKKPFQQEREEKGEKKKMMMIAWWWACGACDVGNNFVLPPMSPLQAGPISPNFHASPTIVFAAASSRDPHQSVQPIAVSSLALVLLKSVLLWAHHIPWAHLSRPL